MYEQKLKDHLSAFIGEPAKILQDEGSSLYVLCYDHTPGNGYTTLCTAGFNKTSVASETADHPLHQEVLWVLDETLTLENTLSCISRLAAHVAASPAALRYGQLIGLETALQGSQDKTNLYLTLPGYFPPEMTFWKGNDAHVMLLQPIPVTDREKDFILGASVGAFDALIQEQDAEVTDMSRSELV